MAGVARHNLEVSGYVLSRVELPDVLLQLVLDGGGVWAVRAAEGLHGQVHGHVALEVPVAGEAAAARGALER